jgi:N-acetylmuramoyl-L-alanine amidase
MRFVLDPGHGGVDSGAVGPTGLKESVVVLRLAERLRTVLREMGHQVTLTRDCNTMVTLQRRVRISDDYAPDVFCSLHANSFEQPQAGGFEVWTTPGQTPADRVATNVCTVLKATFPELRARFDFCDGDPDKETKFYVLRCTNAPAILVELAFLSNPAEEAMLREDATLARFAAAIAAGLTGGKGEREEGREGGREAGRKGGREAGREGERGGADTANRKTGTAG